MFLIMLNINFVVLFEMLFEGLFGFGEMLVLSAVPVAVVAVCHMRISTKAHVYAVGDLEMMDQLAVGCQVGVAILAMRHGVSC